MDAGSGNTTYSTVVHRCISFQCKSKSNTVNVNETDAEDAGRARDKKERGQRRQRDDERLKEKQRETERRRERGREGHECNVSSLLLQFYSDPSW